MRYANRVLLAGVAVLSTASGAEPAAAPAPNSPAIYIDAKQLSQQVAAGIAKGADPALGNIGDTKEYFIHQVHREKTAPAAAHPGWTELHFVLNGTATLVTGGKINGKVIEGGVPHEVHKGDAIVIPADTPHWYQKIDGKLDVLEVRFISPSASK